MPSTINEAARCRDLSGAARRPGSFRSKPSVANSCDRVAGCWRGSSRPPVASLRTTAFRRRRWTLASRAPRGSAARASPPAASSRRSMVAVRAQAGARYRALERGDAESLAAPAAARHACCDGAPAVEKNRARARLALAELTSPWRIARTRRNWPSSAVDRARQLRRQARLAPPPAPTHREHSGAGAMATLSGASSEPDSATAPRTAHHAGRTPRRPARCTKTNADQFFARGAQPYTLCSFFSVLCSCLSQPLAWLKFVLAFLYARVSWKCNCGSLWDFVLMGVVRRVTYAAQSAKFTDRVTQAFIDLVPALDTVLDLLLGRGCSSCPVSTAVLAKGSDVGCGEWLWPNGAGRAGDDVPSPLPSSTASPKTGRGRRRQDHPLHSWRRAALCCATTARTASSRTSRPPHGRRRPRARVHASSGGGVPGGARRDGKPVYREVVGFYDPANVIVAGDSAGGNLALTVTMKAIASGLPAPRALLLISPWCDLTAAALDAPSMAANAPTDYLPLPLIGHFADDYADGADASGPAHLARPRAVLRRAAARLRLVRHRREPDGPGRGIGRRPAAGGPPRRLARRRPDAARLALFAPLVYGPSAPAADGAADGAAAAAAGGGARRNRGVRQVALGRRRVLSSSASVCMLRSTR